MRVKITSARLSIGTLLLSLFLSVPRETSAQSLGELARQQRERVNGRRTRVFTNEDLAKQKIVEDTPPVHREVYASIPVQIVRPADQPALTPLWSAVTPLGDVARYYREQKNLIAPLPLPAPEMTPEPVLAAEEKPETDAPFRSPAPVAPQQPAQKPKRVIASTSASTSLPAAPREPQGSTEPHVVVVVEGDSLWKIAARHLGSPQQWREIAAANPDLSDPNHIRVGQQLRLPVALSAAASTIETEAAVENSIRVQSGDSLWKLAKAEWGNGAAWTCIAESNPQVSASGRIYPGQILMLPSSCSPRA
jgi:nucleoid-associated protein YgaU